MQSDAPDPESTATAARADASRPAAAARAEGDFSAAARWAGSLVAGLGDPDWSAPGLGDWDLRALVGHTSRALLTVEQYLGRPAQREEIAGPAEYFRRTRDMPGADPADVHARGVAAGEALGADPAAAFSRIADRVLELVRGAGDPMITCIVGGIRLSDYLPTRTFELVVHGVDIARAAGVDPAPPLPALRSSAVLAAELAVDNGDGARILEALTGRGALERGFTVLG